jgi:hypothetical protein
VFGKFKTWAKTQIYNFLRSAGVNPVFLALLLVLAWKNAGWWGLSDSGRSR